MFSLVYSSLLLFLFFFPPFLCKLLKAWAGFLVLHLFSRALHLDVSILLI